MRGSRCLPSEHRRATAPRSEAASREPAPLRHGRTELPLGVRAPRAASGQSVKVARVSALVALVGLGAFARVYFRKSKPDWVVGTGIGLVIINTFAAGAVRALSAPWAAVVLVTQTAVTAALLTSMWREWRQWASDGSRA